MKKITKLILFISAASLLQSCAQQKAIEKKIEKEIREEPPVKQEDVVESAREYIMKAPNLSDEQKKKLISIQEKAVVETSALKEEINKARMILIKSAFEPSYNAREVEALKKRILKLERKKLRVGLNAFTEARNVIQPGQLGSTKALNKIFMHENLPPF